MCGFSFIIALYLMSNIRARGRIRDGTRLLLLMRLSDQPQPNPDTNPNPTIFMQSLTCWCEIRILSDAICMI
jgi:hypothetical protein